MLTCYEYNPTLGHKKFAVNVDHASHATLVCRPLNIVVLRSCASVIFADIKFHSPDRAPSGCLYTHLVFHGGAY